MRKPCIVHSQKTVHQSGKRYAEENPDDVKIISENADGSIYASLPLKYLKITRPNAGREYTEEEKRISRERLNMYRNQKKKEG